MTNHSWKLESLPLPTSAATQKAEQAGSKSPHPALSKQTHALVLKLSASSGEALSLRRTSALSLLLTTEE